MGLKARVWLALSSKKKATVRFAKNQTLFSLKIFTPYWAPKDVKSFSIIVEFFARVKQVLLSRISIQRYEAFEVCILPGTNMKHITIFYFFFYFYVLIIINIILLLFLIMHLMYIYISILFSCSVSSKILAC